MTRHKIIFYKTAISNSNIDIIYEEENFWLSQKKLAELFGTQVPAINKHIKNILEEEELTQSTISKLEIVQFEGTREVKREVEHYSLDMIIYDKFKLIQNKNYQSDFDDSIKELMSKYREGK